MFKLFRLSLAALACFVSAAHADVLWVGSSTACSAGTDTFTNIDGALFTAALRSGADEIRLTNTLSYTGSSNRLDLIDWSPATVGALTISGGFSDCFSGQSGRTRIGDAAGPIIRVRTSSQPISEVRLRNLVIAGSTSLRGLDVSGGAEVFLQNTLIDDNIAGVIVTGGAFLDIDADSRIQSNLSPGMVEFGGGLRCSGADTLVSVRGRLVFNYGDNGGNLYVGNGCFVELFQGARIIDGRGLFGGGAYVDNGGVLLASGAASLILFEDNFVDGDGGGLYIRGSGRATLVNTVFRNNRTTREGAAIYAINGGSSGSPQLVMDRTNDCPFLISCSELEQNQGPRSIVFASNSNIRMQRTLFDQNLFSGTDVILSGAIYLSDSSAFINRVGFIGNEIYAPISTQSSDAVIRHVTVVDNTFLDDPGLDSFAMSIRGAGDVDVYNSVFADTRGIDNVTPLSFSSICNLVDDPFNWPFGTVDVGMAQFINAAGGDLRQLPSSPGVDMCNAQPGAPANDRDLEFQLAPVNEFTNPQGAPGQAGGLWDAGVDEVYSTIGDDVFTLTVARNGSGSGSVVSTPLGIACGSDCSEEYFQGTLVTLFANAATGSEFAGWIGCPLANGNECFYAVDADRTITATFTSTVEFTLTVERSGNGAGIVNSTPAGINCGADCSEAFVEDTLVTLFATAFGGSTFGGWIGCPLTNGNQCFNTVDSNRTITAVFDLEQFELTVVKSGSGDGRVTSTPAGIDCGTGLRRVLPAGGIGHTDCNGRCGKHLCALVELPVAGRQPMSNNNQRGSNDHGVASKMKMLSLRINLRTRCKLSGRSVVVTSNHLAHDGNGKNDGQQHCRRSCWHHNQETSMARRKPMSTQSRSDKRSVSRSKRRTGRRPGNPIALPLAVFSTVSLMTAGIAVIF